LSAPYCGSVARPERKLPSASIEFGSTAWRDEVERFDQRSRARIQAERARREIEAGRSELAWHRCEADGPRGTRLPGCRKLYVPLGKPGASDAPFGFVFRLSQKSDGSLSWSLIAFGERHPADRRIRNVYERAHKRLHGRYPNQFR
jgi:hypothetical protein